jgi:hypothetical protein
MKTVKAVRERKVVDEDESDDYGSRRRSGRGVKRRRPSTPRRSTKPIYVGADEPNGKKPMTYPTSWRLFTGRVEQFRRGYARETGRPSPPPTVSEAGSTTIVAEQLAADVSGRSPAAQEPTIPAPEDDGLLPSAPSAAPDTKKGKGGRKSNTRFWVYAEVDEDALPKDLPDPDALMRKPRRSLAGEKQGQKASRGGSERQSPT